MRPSQERRLKIAYVSGPMRNIKDLNYPMFNRVAKSWRDAGYVIYNPAENFGGYQHLSVKDYIRLDLQQVLDSDFLIMLPGWQRSEGAKVEKGLAELVGTPCLVNHDVLDPLDEAVLRAYLRL